MTTRGPVLLLGVALLCVGGAVLHAQSSDRFDALVGLARVKRDAGDHAGARRYFEQAREIRPLDPGMQVEYFWTLAYVDSAAAILAGTEALERRPADDVVRDRVIMLAIGAGDEAAVLALAGSGAEREPGRALWHRRTAESLARLGRHRDAATAYVAAVRGTDTNVADRAGLALMLEASGDFAGARQAWNNISAAERRARPDWERSRLRAVVRTAPASEAARELTAWLNEWPDDVEARETLVGRLTEAGNVEGALRAMQPLLNGPRRRYWIAREIDVAWAGGRPDLAIARLDRIVSSGEATLGDRVALAELLLGDRAFPRAEAVLREAAHVAGTCDARLFELADRIPGPPGTTLLIEQIDVRDCRDQPAWLLRGVARATAEGRHAEALRMLELVPEMHRTGARERRLHGQLRLWTGDAASAVRLLQPVVAADPDDTSARDALVDALRTLGDASAAWRDAAPLLDAPDTSESRLEVLAELALEADQPAAVSRILRRLSNQNDGQGRHAGLEGRALLALGQPAAAAARLASVPIGALTTSAVLALIDSTFEVRGVRAALDTARRVATRPDERDLVARRLMLELLAGDATAAASSRVALAPSDAAAPRFVDAEVALAQQRPFDALAILSTISSPEQAQRLADLRVTALAGTGDLQSASALLQTLRRNRPAFAPFVMREAELNWWLTPGPATLAAVLALPSRFPGHTGAAITAARALAFERHHVDVVSVLGGERGLPLLPLEGRLLMARSLFEMGRGEAALDAVVDHELRGSGAIFRAEVIARVQGEEAGRLAFEALVARRDASTDTFLGWAALTSDRRARVDILERAVARFDSDPQVWSNLAVAHAAAGNRARSVEAAGRAVSLDPFAADAWFQLLAHSAAMRDPAALATLMERFRAASASRPALLIGMADRLAGLVRSADDPLLTSALVWLTTSPVDSALLVSRDLAVVRLLAAGERWHKAVSAADDSVLAHPESAAAVRLRADVLSWAGRHDEAIAAYGDYLTLVPTDVDARRQQARVAGWAGRFDDARRFYAALRTGHADDAAITAEARAKRAFFDGRWRDAVKLYDEWLQLEPTNGEARFEMAEAQRAAGDRGRANAGLMALSPEGGHRLADAALARDAWQREPSVAALFEARSANGYGGQRLLDLRRSGGGVDLVVGQDGRTTLSAEVMAVLAVAADARRAGYQGGITAAHDLRKSISLEGHASLWGVSGASGTSTQLRSAATWTANDRWTVAGGMERERLLDNLSTIDRGVMATGLFAGAGFQSPRTSMALRSSWQTLSDGNRRRRLSVSATRAVSERLSHVRAVVWSELLDYRRPSATYFAPNAFLRVDGGAEYTHLLSQPRFRGDRMNLIVVGYLVGTDFRGTFYQHPSIRLGWEVSESIALSVRGDVVRSRSYNENSVVVSMHLVGGAFTR